MSTISSTLALQDRMSPAFSAITKAMSSTLMVIQSIAPKTEQLGPEFAAAAADVKLAEIAVNQMNQELQKTPTATQAATTGIVNVESAVSGIIQELQGISSATQQAATSLSAIEKAQSGIISTEKAIDEINQSLVNASQSSQETIGAISGVESALQRESETAYEVSSATMTIENAIHKANDAMNIAASNAENYKSKLEQIVEAMDKNEAAVIKLEKQQEKTFSDKRQTEIEKLIAKQDKLNESYSKTEISLMKANATYEQQKSKVEQLNQKLFETANKNEQIQKQGDSMKSPFDKWAIRITGVNSALRLARRILRTISNGFNAVMNATEEWEGVMRKFNERTGEAKATIGEELLPLAAIASDLFSQAFDWIAQKAVVGIQWIKENIGLVTNAIALAITFALIAAAAFAIANAPAFALIGIVILIAKALTDMGFTAEDILGAIGGAIGGLAAIIQNIFIFLYNHIIAPFAELFANFLDDPIGSIMRALADMADGVLLILEKIASGIDWIFGSNLAEAVSGWRSGLQGIVEEKYGAGAITVERMAYKDIGEYISSGEQFGVGIGEKLTGIGDTLENFDLSKYSTPDNTLKTTSEVKIDSEDLQMLLDISTRGFFDVTYQTLTPQIAVNIDTIRETANVDQLMDALTDVVVDTAGSSLYYARG